ncbi:MAG: ADP-ribosylglycohydrolase family protein [Synergistaceae bacterium]|nr:ADP-ribosylglycohydrolase family protein [Candidatus Equadaptatus faecalis]
MLGAIIGDIVGSRFEFANIHTKDFDFFSEECRFTDDSVMTCAVAKAILDCNGDYSRLSEKAVYWMRKIGVKYPGCGYGSRFTSWILISPKPYNSKGNGSAMRVSAAGWLAKSLEEAKEISEKVTAVSHNHPEGIKGAEAVSTAIYLARTGASKEEIREYMEANYYRLGQTVDEIRKTYGFTELCEDTVPQALQCFYEGTDYEDVIRNCISIGGDSDTLAAIAGGIAEAYYEIPAEIVAKARGYLDDRLLEIVSEFLTKTNKQDKYDCFKIY